jgi:hypothetical protein
MLGLFSFFNSWICCRAAQEHVTAAHRLAVVFVTHEDSPFVGSLPTDERLTLGEEIIGWIEFSRDSPDESQTGINVRVFPALLQDRREVLTATSTSDNPNAWSRV